MFHIKNQESFGEQLESLQLSQSVQIGKTGNLLPIPKMDDASGILNYSGQAFSFIFDSRDLPKNNIVTQNQKKPQSPKHRRRQFFKKYKKNAQRHSDEIPVTSEKNFDEVIQEVFKQRASQREARLEGQRRLFTKYAKPQETADLPTFEAEAIQSNKSIQNTFDDTAQLDEILESPFFRGAKTDTKISTEASSSAEDVLDKQQKNNFPSLKLPKNLSTPSPWESEREMIRNYVKVEQNFKHSSEANIGKENTWRQQCKYAIPQQQVFFNQKIQGPSINHFPSVEECQPKVLPIIYSYERPQSRRGSEQHQFQTQNQAFDEERIPIFLRKARKLNSFYINFYHPEAHKFYAENNKRLQAMVKQFCNVLNFLEIVGQEINDNLLRRHELSCKMQLGLTLDYFLNSGWQRMTRTENLDKLKPKSAFPRRVFDYQRIRVAIRSYKEVTSYYRDLQIDFGDERGRQKYEEIRRKLWAVEWNIKIISQDLYAQIFQCNFPDFFDEYIHFLKKASPRYFSSEAAEERNRLLRKLMSLKHQKDYLSCSEVGTALKNKLERELEFLCSF